MFTQILVPVDGSALAERVLPCAEQLAKAGQGTVHLVGVIDVPPLPPDVHEREWQRTTAYVSGLRDRLAASGATVRALPLAGKAGIGLLEYEREEPIDLVVICAHGGAGPAPFPLGARPAPFMLSAVAERLLDYGTVPVLMVRAYGAPVDFAHVVVPLDGSARSELVLPVVRGLIPAVVQEVTLVRAMQNAGDRQAAEHYLEEHADPFRAAGASCTWYVQAGSPMEVIVQAAGATKLVAMASNWRSGITRWTQGSVADRVARGGAAGVLAVRGTA